MPHPGSGGGAAPSVALPPDSSLRVADQTRGVSGNPGTDAVRCSAKGCRAVARWALVWNNPRLHTPDREKVWTACDEHRGQLSHHLAVRSFLLRVDQLG
jgi:hypothetical protein